MGQDCFCQPRSMDPFGTWRHTCRRYEPCGRVGLQLTHSRVARTQLSAPSARALAKKQARILLTGWLPLVLIQSIQQPPHFWHMDRTSTSPWRPRLAHRRFEIAGTWISPGSPGRFLRTRRLWRRIFAEVLGVPSLFFRTGSGRLPIRSGFSARSFETVLQGPGI